MQKILQGMVKELAALKNLDSLISKIAGTIEEALYVSKISLVLWSDKEQRFKAVKGETTAGEEVITPDDPFLSWMKEEDRVIESEEIELDPKFESIRPFAQSYFKNFDARIALPLMHDGKLIGLINLGEKANLKSFSSMDLDFLSNLRAEASIALSNSLLYDDVSKMSEELRQWANDLERKVEERTHELAESNHQLEESYQKLRELDAFKSQLFANISHEFRTPLTLMLAPIDAIRKQKMSDRVQIHRQLDIAYNNGLRLLKLINNLLDLAKIDAGKMDLQYRQVNLSTFLRGIMAEMSQVAEQRGLTLHLSVQDLSLTAFLDPEKIEKVILNLLFNAIKFTPSGGKITVTCRLEGEQVCISVRDTGVGIPPEVQSKIFDRFFQAHGATTRPHDGTGIGLAIAKELVELHGGTISVKGAPDGGTIFSFTLPWKRETEYSELGPEWIPSEGFGQLAREANYNTADLVPHFSGPKTSISNTGSRPKILVIEDNADMRYFLSEKLSEYYDVLAAADGEEGIQMAKESHPDLILSDVMMPKKDGYEVCRELKNDPDTASLPILLLTAKADLPSKLEGFQSRADDYLIKPFNADELLARVRAQIERRNSVKSLEEFLKEAHRQVKEANLLMMEMAHEIKNPISYAKGNVSLLSRSVKESQQSGEWERTFEEMQSSIQIIEAGLNRVSAIVKDVKEFVSPNLNTRINVSLREIIESTLSVLSYQIDGKITLHRNYETAGAIKGVPEQLHQVFTNLIKNAVEAMNGVGQLWIRISQEGNETIVSIRDDGPGVPNDRLPHLFEPFYTTKREKGGTGLGLAICKKIIEAHHGRIEVRSQAPGGTEFLIFLVSS
jgi:signal transduction histidine kinase